MHAEGYLHNLLAKVCPIDGLRFVPADDGAAWANSLIVTTADNQTCVVDVQASATSDQQVAATAKIQAFNYTSVENTLGEIYSYESSLTMRIMQEAVAGDTTVDPTFCGGTGGTAAQHVTWINSQKATLRATLPQ